MLGLCYRNGFGVERDEELAVSYLQRAANLGSNQAKEELEKGNAEVDDVENITVGGSTVAEESIPDIQPIIVDPTRLDGRFRGVLVTYDWSGSRPVNEALVTLDVKVVGDSLQGTWYDDNDTIPFRCSVNNDGKLMFNNTYIKHADRYSNYKKIPYTFQTADICLDNNVISDDKKIT